MNISGVNFSVNSSNFYNHNQSFMGKINRQTVSNSAKTAKSRNDVRKYKIYLLYSAIAIASMLAAMNGCKKSDIADNNAEYRTLCEKSVYDSIAWDEFEKWYDSNLPYWEKPDWDGVVMKEDFLKFQDAVNAWWDNYYMTNGVRKNPDLIR